MEKFHIDLKSIAEVEFSFDESLRIYLPIYGKIHALINSRSKVINKEEMLIVNPYEAVLIYPDRQNIDNLLFCIEISKNFLSKNKLDDILFNNHVYNERVDSFLLSTIDDIYDLSKSDMVRVEKLLLTVLNKLSEDRYVVRRHSKLTIKEENLIKSYMANYHEDKNFIEKSLKDLSNIFHTSSSYFSKIFKDITGFSLSRFKQLVKIDQSSKILLEGKETIDEVAYIIGYQSPKSLYDIYKTNIGMLPSEYKSLLANVERQTSEELKKGYIYKQFRNYSKNLTYKDIYSKYPRYNHYKVENKKKIFDYSYEGIKIYDLSIVGFDYYNNVKSINDAIGIKYLVINICIDKKNKEQVYIANLNRYITIIELIHFISMLNEEEISLGLTIEILDKDCIDYSKEDYILIKEMQELITNTITYKYSKDYDWGIILKGNYNIGFLRDYIKKRLSLLEFCLGESVKLSIFIGDKNIDQLKMSIGKLEKIGLDNNIRKIYINMVHKEILEVKSLDYNKYINYTYRDLVGKVEACIEEIDYKKNIQICDFILKYDIDNGKYLSNDAILYKDLMLATAYTGSIWHFKENFIYFVFDDINTQKRCKSKLIRENYFKTALAFALYNLKKMEGEVIHLEDGIIAVKNEDDIHLVIYNNLILDSLFAVKKNFQDLDQYKRTIDISLNDLEGKYKIIKKSIDINHGNVLTILNQFETSSLFLDTEIDYIKSVNLPKRRNKVIEEYGDFNFSIEIEPYSVVFIDLLKI